MLTIELTDEEVQLQLETRIRFDKVSCKFYLKGADLIDIMANNTLTKRQRQLLPLSAASFLSRKNEKPMVW